MPARGSKRQREPVVVAEPEVVDCDELEVDLTADSDDEEVQAIGPATSPSHASPDVGSSSTCAQCLAERSLEDLYCLDVCSHKLCPDCQSTLAGSSTAGWLVCPCTGCGKRLGVRDARLILPDPRWRAAQEHQLQEFRTRARAPAGCPACSAELPLAAVPRRGKKQTMQDCCDAALAASKVTCPCGVTSCRVCASAITRNRSHGCAAWRLAALEAIFDLLADHWSSDANQGSGGGGASSTAKGGGRGRGRGRGRGGRGPTSSTYGDLSYGYHGIGGGRWAKGTGFGGASGYGGTSDQTAVLAGMKRAHKAEEERDEDARVLLVSIHALLPNPEELSEQLPAVLALIRESWLLQLVCDYLRNDSLTDISRRQGVYKAILELVQKFARHEMLAPLIDSVRQDRTPQPSNRAREEAAAAAAAAAEEVVEIVAPPKGKGKGKGRAKGKGKAKKKSAAAVAAEAEAARAVEEEAAAAAAAAAVAVAAAAAAVVVVEEANGADAEAASPQAEEPEEVVSVVAVLRNIYLQAKVFVQSPLAAGNDEGEGEDGMDAIAFALQVIEAYEQVEHNLRALRDFSRRLAAKDNLEVAAAAADSGASSGVAAAAASAAAAAVFIVDGVASNGGASSSDGVENSASERQTKRRRTAAGGGASPSPAGKGKKAAAAAAAAEVEAAPVDAALAAKEDAEYVKELTPMRFELVPLLASVRANKDVFCFLSSVGGPTGGSGRDRMVRISQEVSSLATSLPVAADSSIFVRVDEDRFDVIKALIVGPKDTPYECGCFEFDIFLPPTYPNNPPVVQLVTTGGGKTRFNPNLYANGKVCLSLLGTWAGPGWDAKNSTLLQVLISIQSLILVHQPYFNEPGYESSMGTAHGDAASERYNSRIRMATIEHAVNGHLRLLGREGVFADIIRAHFRLKRRSLLELGDKWVEDSPPPPALPSYTPPLLGGGRGRGRGRGKSAGGRGSSAAAAVASYQLSAAHHMAMHAGADVGSTGYKQDMSAAVASMKKLLAAL